MSLPKCPSCESSRNVKRVRDDYFRCSCGSVWESKGYSERERLARFCPVCNTYVEYDNWHLWQYGFWSPWDKGKLRNFHYNCQMEYEIVVRHQQAELEANIKFAEILTKVECPQCHLSEIVIMPNDPLGIIYVCMQCDTVYDEEWVKEKVKEAENERCNGKKTET